MDTQYTQYFQMFFPLMNLSQYLTRVHKVTKVQQEASFPQQCFSIARYQTEHNSSTKAYVEGLLFPEGLPVPIGHAWILNKDGTHIDMTHIEAPDVYYGVCVSAEQFKGNMSDPEFKMSYEKHDMFPYLRACELHNKDPGFLLNASGGGKSQRRIKKKNK
jgi:hypothetical protein